MGSSANNFVRGLLLLSLLLPSWSFFPPTAVASQDSPEAAIFDQALKEVAQECAQLKDEEARAQKQLQAKQRFAREFETLLAKARQQHSKIKQWQKGHAKERKIYASGSRHKKRLLVATTMFR